MTSEPARRDGHKWRARSCAILTRISSVRKDDPQLTVRYITVSRQPMRIVVDSNLKPPCRQSCCRMQIQLGSSQLINEKIHRLEDTGAHIVVLPDLAGKVDLKAMMVKLAN
ncbi:MAG: dihydrofolate reductase family protein [Nitrosomonas sp.]|nr:dihydrofolate reductase family protein [Nitrosomonas sp.]